MFLIFIESIDLINSSNTSNGYSVNFLNSESNKDLSSDDSDNLAKISINLIVSLDVYFNSDCFIDKTNEELNNNNIELLICFYNNNYTNDSNCISSDENTSKTTITHNNFRGIILYLSFSLKPNKTFIIAKTNNNTSDYYFTYN